jgi:DNA-binding protein YbaB
MLTRFDGWQPAELVDASDRVFGEALEALRLPRTVSAEAGNGAVVVRVHGRGAITAIHISPLSCRSDNAARLAGQILDAVQAARRQSARTRWACLDAITFAGRPVRDLLPEEES